MEERERLRELAMEALAQAPRASAQDRRPRGRPPHGAPAPRPRSPPGAGAPHAHAPACAARAARGRAPPVSALRDRAAARAGRRARGRDRSSSTRRSSSNERPPRRPAGPAPRACREAARAGPRPAARRRWSGATPLWRSFARRFDQAAGGAGRPRRDPRGGRDRQEPPGRGADRPRRAARRRGCSLGRAYESDQILLFGRSSMRSAPAELARTATVHGGAGPRLARRARCACCPRSAPPARRRCRRRSTTGGSSNASRSSCAAGGPRAVAPRPRRSALGGRAERAAPGVPGRAACRPSGSSSSSRPREEELADAPMLRRTLRGSRRGRGS